MRLAPLLFIGIVYLLLVSASSLKETPQVFQDQGSEKALGSSSLGLILDKSALKYSDEAILEILGFSGYKNYLQIPDSLKSASGSKRHFINICRADSSVWIFSDDLGKYLKCDAPIKFKELAQFELAMAIIDWDDNIGYAVYKKGMRIRANHSLENWKVVREGAPLEFERPYLLAPTSVARKDPYDRAQLLYSIKEDGVVLELDDQQLTTKLLHLAEQHFFGFYVSFEKEGAFNSWARYVGP